MTLHLTRRGPNGALAYRNDDAKPSGAPRHSSRVAVLRGRGFRRYLAGFGASLLADGVWFVALGWAAGQLGNAFETSVVMAAGSIPRALLLIVGGALADRRGLLRTVLATQRLRLLVMFSFTVAAATIGPELVPLVLAASLFGLLDAFHMPAVAALPPVLVRRDELPAAQGVVQTLERLAMVVAAPLAGILLAYAGVPAVAASATVILLVALGFLGGLQTSADEAAASSSRADQPQTHLLRDVGDGLRSAARHDVIGPILLVVTVVNLGLSAPLNVGLPLLSAHNNWTAAAFGLIIGAFGAGAAIGALSVLAWRPRHPALGGLVWVAVGALAVIALGSVAESGLAVAIAAFLGFTSGPASALLLGLVQAHAAEDNMARVMSLVAFSAVGLVPIGYLVFGLAADWMGVELAYLISGLLELAAVAVAFTRRSVRTATL